jgi:hypothetical protein
LASRKSAFGASTSEDFLTDKSGCEDRDSHDLFDYPAVSTTSTTFGKPRQQKICCRESKVLKSASNPTKSLRKNE